MHAFSMHLMASAVIASISAALVFFLWYPKLLAYASGVQSIFLILLLVDVALGPLITLIIFDTKKIGLKRDLIVVAAIQISALLFGIYTVFVARPVYLVFNDQRFDLVYANDISEKNLSMVKTPEFSSLPYFGPKIIAAELPADPKLATQIIYSAISGGEDVQDMPQYYSQYGEKKELILKVVIPLKNLIDSNKDKHDVVNSIIKKYSDEKKDVGYLPLKGKENDLTVIIDKSNAEILDIVNLKPWVHFVPQYVPIKK